MNTKLYHVAGPDIDLEMLRVLTPGDTVLAEINGARLFSTAPNPCASDAPWSVEENAPDDYLVLSNPRAAEDLRLRYADLITSGGKQPAVFELENSPYNSPAVPKIIVILQFVACKCDEDTLPYEPLTAGGARGMVLECSDDDRVKMGLLTEIHKGIRKYHRAGWQVNSINRLVLRSQVPLAVVRAFRDGCWKTLLDMDVTTDEHLVALIHEMHLTPALLAQSELAEDREVSAVRPLRATGGVRVCSW